MRKRTVIGFASLLLGSAVLVGSPLSRALRRKSGSGPSCPSPGSAPTWGADEGGHRGGGRAHGHASGGRQADESPRDLVRRRGQGDVGLNVVTRALTVDKIHVGMGFLSSDVSFG